MENEFKDVMIAELKRARKIIHAERHAFICLSLIDEYGHDPSEEEMGAIDHLCDYIEDALMGASYRAWLTRHCQEYAAATPSESRDMERAARLAWIDAMIAALENGEELTEKPSLPEDYKGEV